MQALLNQFWRDKEYKVLMVVSRDPFGGRGFTVYKAVAIKGKDTRNLRRDKSFGFYPSEEMAVQALITAAKAKGWQQVDLIKLREIERARVIRPAKYGPLF